MPLYLLEEFKGLVGKGDGVMQAPYDDSAVFADELNPYPAGGVEDAAALLLNQSPPE